MEKIIVKVPATSANLGPGFDCLGIALNLYNTFIFERKDKFEFINVLEKYCNENNMVVRSALTTYEYLGVEPICFSLEESEEVPISRGLGSSATCIVAGIMAANYFCNNKLTKSEIVKIATSIEGHPDNVAPAIVGGLVSSVMVDNEVMYTKHKVSDNLLFTVCIPNFQLPTVKARQVLPKRLNYNDIVYSMSRAINIPNAMSRGDIKSLYKLMDDKLHEPYRMKLIQESSRFKELSKRLKIPFCISGSGSTLLYISDREVESKLSNAKYRNKWIFKTLKPDMEGTRLEVINEE